MGVSYSIVKFKSCLGVIVHKKTGTAEDKMFNKSFEEIKANFNEKFDGQRKECAD